MFTRRLFYLLTLVILLVVTACAPQVVPPSAPSPTVMPTEIPTQTPLPVLVETSQVEPNFAAISAGELWIATQPHRQHLVLIKPDGTGSMDILTQLPQEQFHPDWSPDGTQLTFEHAPQGPDADVRDIWISDANGDHARALGIQYPVDLEGLWWANPAWSRDGKSIAMIGYKGNAQTGLPTRSVLVTVDVASGEMSVVADVMLSSNQLYSFPRWSPDGKAFVIAVSQFNGEDFTGQAIAIIRKTDSGWLAPNVITSFGSGLEVLDGLEDLVHSRLRPLP